MGSAGSDQDRRVPYAAEHLANERTFMAWIRTSVGIIAFGFVIERFALFTHQMAMLLGKAVPDGVPMPGQGYSVYIGALLVVCGTAMSLAAFLQFSRARKQIAAGCYVPPVFSYLLISGVVCVAGCVLAVYLVSLSLRIP